MTLEENILNPENKPLSYKGLPLFNEFEDAELRRRNQAVIMANVLEDNFLEGKITTKGASLLINYFSLIPEGERVEVKKQFIENARSRGFDIE